ncbi:MAG: asparagine synthase (glutamine-hydrolyzing), partial [Verrucomicrobia bacterium]|nr:asparagine synthase (glutamine-hydrolyzing) [Verrucomicrobiota bacterium]
STGDTEVLLRALSEWGDAALEQLDGMFALAFYHAASRRVLLARDPMGIKPLYVAKLPGRVVFASEVRAMLASGLVPADLDQAGIASFLAYGAPQDPLTVHRFVKSMAAGSCEWIGAGQLQGKPALSRRFWRFPTTDPTIQSLPAISKTRELLADSVRRQSLADVPVGVFLSAGIDSATMAALALPQLGAVHTFSVGFQEAFAIDESKLAEETARALGTSHYQTTLDKNWGPSQFVQWLKAADRPSIDGLNTYVITDAVKDRGISVAISGLGADELFGGYSIFRRAARLKQVLGPFRWTPRWLRRQLGHAALLKFPSIKRAKAAEMLARGESPAALAVYSRRMFLDNHLEMLGFNAEKLGLTADYLPADGCEGLQFIGDPFKEVSQAELSLYMRNTLLRDSDVYSMAHSLELRVPFLGQKLVDYVCTLPGAVLAPPRTKPKHVLREAIKDLLPPQVFSRPKTGFILPVDSWMNGELMDLCESAIDGLAASPALDGKEVRKLWQQFNDKRFESFYWRRLAMVVLGKYFCSGTG